MKRLLIPAIVLALLATPAVAQTLIKGSQIDRTWQLLSGRGLGINVTSPRATLDIGGSLSGRTLTLSGLRTCTLKTTATGMIVCGTDQTGGGGSTDTGALLNAAEGRFVNQGGDTMTGALKVRANLSGSTLNVDDLRSCNTIDSDASGRLTCGTDADTSQNLFETIAVSGQSNVVADAATDTLTLAGGSNVTITTTAGSDTVTIAATDTNTTYTFGQGLTTNGTLIRLSDAFSGTALEIMGVASGTTVHATTQLRSSGSLVAEGAVTFASLVSCENLQTSSAGALACNTTDYLTETELDTIGELETQVGAVNILVSTEVDTESELETLLTDVTDVFTNNDGALDDDDLSDNTTADLAENTNQYFTNERVDDRVDALLTDGYALTSTYNDGANTLTLDVSQSALDVRYLNVSGDTGTGALKVRANLSGSTLNVDSLRNCNTIDTDSAGRLSCGTDETAGSGLGQTEADARYVNVSGDTMTGALAIVVTGGDNNTVALEFPHTASGRHVHAQDLASFSGTLSVDGAATFAGAVNITSGNLSNDSILEPDLNADNSPSDGDVLTYDSTGTNFNWITPSAGTDITADLEEETHATEHDEGGADALTVESLASSCTDAQVIGGNGSGGAECQTDANTTYTFGQGLTTAGTLIRLSDSFSGTSLRIYGTASGSRLYAANHIGGSGTLTVDGAVRLKNLSSCETIQSASNGALSCNTNNYVILTEIDTESELEGVLTDVTDVFTNNDGSLADDDLSDNTTADLSENTNLYYTNERVDDRADALIVDGQGITTSYDDAAGVLSIRVNATLSGSLARFATLSGATVYAKSLLSSSGGLSVEGATHLQSTVRVTGNATVEGAMSGRTLTVSALKSCNTLDTDANGLLSCGTDDGGSFTQTTADGRYVNTSGDTMTGSLAILVTGGGNTTVALEFPHTASGRQLHAQDLVTSSGGLSVEGATHLQSHLRVTGNATVEGAMSGRTLTISTLKSCSLIMTDANGLTSCGTAYTQTIADARFVNTSGDSMTGALTIRPTAAVGLNVAATMSGRSLWVSGTGASPLLVTHLGTGRVGVGTSAPKVFFEAAGAMSGRSLTISGLKSCDTIDTDENGLLECGTDEGGAGSGLSYDDAEGIFVNQGGDTMTGSLKVRANLSGSTLTVTSIKDCTTTGTAGSGALFCSSGADRAGVTNSAGAGASDATVGSQTWSNPGNIVSSNDSYANHSGDGDSCTLVENSVKLFKGGAVSGDDKSTGRTITSSDVVYTFGGSTDLWGATLTPGDVNRSDFGFGISYTVDNTTTQYLYASSFGFAIPRYAVINGITATVESKSTCPGGTGKANVDHMTVTVTYSLPTDIRFVNVAGDTMTGALVIQNGSTHSPTATRLLNVRGTMSGQGLFVAGGASGQLLVNQGTATASWRYEKEFERFTVFGANTKIRKGSGTNLLTAFSGTIIGATLLQRTAASGVTVSLFVNNNRIFSTPLTTDNREVASTTAATPAVIDLTKNRFNKNDTLRFDVSGTGAVAGTGLNLTIFYNVHAW